MNKSLILLALMASLLAACSKKEDQNVEATTNLQGAWTLSSQTQHGQTITPVSKAKNLDQFGSSTTPTLQLDILGTSLRFIETDFVQVTATDYALSVYNNTLFLINSSDPSAPQETIPFELKDNNNTLVLSTLNDGILVFTKANSQTLATKTALAVNKEQLVDAQFFVSFAGSTSSPLQIPTKGIMQNVQKAGDKVVVKCTYNHQTKQATIFYSNIDDSPDTKMTIIVGLDFNLASKSENSLFTGEGTIDSDIYGKKITGTKVQCAGSMSRVELYTKLDMRCNGLTLDGTTGSKVDMAAKTQCLF